MTSTACVITAAVENGLRTAAQEVCQVFANQLAEKGMLNCKPSEAMELLGTLEITTKRSAAMKKVRAAQKSSDSSESKKEPIRGKPDMLLPFCGTIEESWCKGVRYNHGLHTQCTNGPHKSGEYCKTCQKSADNSASSKPTYGDIRDRLLSQPLEYRDPKGKLTTCYANVAKKMGLDIARASEVATAFGWTIPEVQLVETATKRGRPASEKKKKSTVKKTGKVVAKKSNSMDDQIAQLVAEAAEEVLGASPDEITSPVKKTIKVKAKKVKKPKKVDPEKEATKKAKADAAAVKKAEREAKKAAAAELKAQKEAEREAKKVAAAELKAQKEAEKKAKAEAAAVKKAEREAKKVAAAEVKAQKEAEKKAKAEAAAEVKAQKEADKLTKAKKEQERLAKLEQKALEKASVVSVDSSEDDAEGKESEASDGGDMFAGAWDKDQPLETKSPKELETEEFDFDAVLDSSDDEEEDEISLTSDLKVTISGIDYFKTPAYGLPAVLFHYPSGEPVGAYDEGSGEIQVIEFDE